MISFNYEVDFTLPNKRKTSTWLKDVIALENFKLEEVNYIFCDDAYLCQLNLEFLKHDTLTDIISFDYTVGKLIQGDIFISIERVKENAITYNVPFITELHRVMVHGILHYCGYKDKIESDIEVMRHKEDIYLNLMV